MFELYIPSFLFIIVLPLLLGYGLARMFHVKPGVFALGALTFVASQVVHIPLLSGLTYLFNAGILPNPALEYKLIFNAIVLGLAAGLCEEIARYLIYRFWLPRQRTWPDALMFGAGHGGVEAILVAASGLAAFAVFLSIQSTGLDQFPPEQHLALEQLAAAFQGAQWYTPFLAILERVFAMTFHIAMSVVVLEALLRRNLGWLVFAILAHTLLDACAVYLAGTVGALWTELAMFGFALASLGLIFYFRQRQPLAPPPPAPLPSPEAPQ